MNTSLQDHALEQYSRETAMEQEDKLWWFQGRKAIIRSYLEKAKQILPLSAMMDIRCGAGVNLDNLSEFGKVWGIERSKTLAEGQRQKSHLDLFPCDSILILPAHAGPHMQSS